MLITKVKLIQLRSSLLWYTLFSKKKQRSKIRDDLKPFCTFNLYCIVFFIRWITKVLYGLEEKEVVDEGRRKQKEEAERAEERREEENRMNNENNDNENNDINEEIIVLQQDIIYRAEHEVMKEEF